MGDGRSKVDITGNFSSLEEIVDHGSSFVWRQAMWMWEAGLGSLESAFQRQSDFDLWDNRSTPARANARGFTLMLILPKTGKKEVLV